MQFVQCSLDRPCFLVYQLTFELFIMGYGSGCFGGDDEEVWISKQQVTLVKFRLKKEPKKETFPKATKFVIQ